MMTKELSFYQATLESPLGMIGIRTNEEKITHLVYLLKNHALIKPATYIAKEAVVQLQCYFADPTYPFQLALQIKGTPFQEKLWHHLLTIPVGATYTYGEIAKALNSNPRAVGNACRVNPLPIFVPCHRIVAQDGIGGYTGETSGIEIDRKRWLLTHENTRKTMPPALHHSAQELFTV